MPASIPVPVFQARLFVLGMFSLLGACTGTIASAGAPGLHDPGSGPLDPDGRPRTTPGQGGTSGAGQGGASGSGGNQAASCTGVSAPYLRLYRLTNQQYDNVLQDLLGDNTRPAGVALPADGRVGYFEVAQPINDAVMEGLWSIAEQTAVRATANLPALLACADGDEPCLRKFIGDFGRKMFRRPLATPEVDQYVTVVYKPVRAGADYKTGIEAILRAMLLSPSFLHRVDLPKAASGTHPLGPYEIASRLSFFLWQSAPDVPLLDAAAAGKLGSAAGVKAEAERMLGHAHANRMYQAFAEQWLNLSELENVNSTAKILTPAMRESMRDETVRFVTANMAIGRTLTNLMTSSSSYINRTLAPIYSVTPPTSPTAFEERVLPQRGGVLTQAGLLTALSHTDNTSPILRGNWVMQAVMCAVPPPPLAPVPIPPDQKTGETAREYWERFPEFCQGCHRPMNGIGFSFQSYDAYGRHRTVEAMYGGGTAPIDDSGWLDGGGDKFKGVLELGRKLAVREDVQRCMARNVFAFAFSQMPVGDAGACVVNQLFDAFVRGKAELRSLLLGVVTNDGFRHATIDSSAPEGA